MSSWSAPAHAGLEREGEQRTWRFPTEVAEPHRLDVGTARVEDGWVYYRDADQDTMLHIYATGAVGGPDARMDVRAKGRLFGEPAAIQARAPSLKLTRDQPLELWTAATVGPTSAVFDGTVQLGETDLGWLEGGIELQGDSASHLERLIGIGAPATPPYRFKGQVRHSADVWAFEPFALHVGHTDLQGQLTWDGSGATPLLRGELASQVLVVSDLAQIISPGPTKPGARVFPTQELPAQQLRSLDANVTYRAQKVEGWRRIGVGSLEAELLAKGGVLHLPTQVALAGGSLLAKVVLDSTEEPPRGDLNVETLGLELVRFFPV